MCTSARTTGLYARGGGCIRLGVANQNPQSAKISSAKFCKRPIRKNFVPRKFGAIRYCHGLLTISGGSDIPTDYHLSSSHVSVTLYTQACQCSTFVPCSSGVSPMPICVHDCTHPHACTKHAAVYALRILRLAQPHPNFFSMTSQSICERRLINCTYKGRLCQHSAQGCR